MFLKNSGSRSQRWGLKFSMLLCVVLWTLEPTGLTKLADTVVFGMTCHPQGLYGPSAGITMICLPRWVLSFSTTLPKMAADGKAYWSKSTPKTHSGCSSDIVEIGTRPKTTQSAGQPSSEQVSGNMFQLLLLLKTVCSGWFNPVWSNCRPLYSGDLQCDPYPWGNKSGMSDRSTFKLSSTKTEVLESLPWLK